jgi:DNA-binding SARP family transcriptional activator/pimeloyl-ACP methyl ester carboxylesterase
MQIRILGPMEVRTDSGELCLPGGSKQRLLLAILLLHSPRVASVDRLIECLWGDGRPEDPTASLRTQISRLRRFLSDAGAGEGSLQSEPYGYRLSGNAFQSDAMRMERLVQESRTAPTSQAELSLLEEALALWGGEPFEEFSHIPAFLGRIRSLVELRHGALERRVELLLELQRVPEALAGIEPELQADPLRERTVALRMRALYQAGRQSEALAAYQDYRRLMSDELGLDPSPALRQLHAEILRHERPPEVSAAFPRDIRLGDIRHQDIRFCAASDGVRLAYATVGDGPPLVKAANWLNHLEFDWESPVWRRLFRELSARNRLIRYDERGSGLSDWDPPEISLDAWVLDLESIVEATGLQRFPLLGISQGCAVCIEYAARHPERVSGLILHGGYAAGWRVDPDCPPAEVARRDASIEIVRHGWGEDTAAYRQMFTQTFIPGGTPEEVEWFNELERRSVSPENAARFMEAFAYIDVRHRLSEVQAPTLVLHSRGDQRIHHNKGRELAMGIPTARFVLLESPNHLILEHEPAFEVWMREATRFLSVEVSP